jgi:Ca2+-binding RTX toxin-like protein
MIEIDLEQEPDAAVVLANGTPVGLVEGATDMTTDHVRVVMSEITPEKSYALDDLGAADVAPEEDAPVSEPDPNGKADAQDLAALDILPDDATDTTTDPAADDLSGIVTMAIEDNPDVVETISDGLPDAQALDDLMDGARDGLTDLGDRADMLDARAAMDDAFGTGGEDALTGSFNDDAITGSDGQDALFGDDGDDTLVGNGGNDELHGDFGDDLLLGGDGADFLDGGEGQDLLDGGAGRDMLFGGDGDDQLHGGDGDDALHGGSGSDTLNGGSGNDLLNGTYGSNGTDRDDFDALLGGDGDDTILIGQGDTAIGGAGADVFTTGDYMLPADFAGMVQDFDPVEDRIEVLYDPDMDPDPVIEVQDFSDGTGADIILNGEVILSVTGAQGLNPAMIDLRAVA